VYTDWSVGNVVSASKKLSFHSGKFYNEIIANFAIQCSKKKSGMNYERLINDPQYYMIIILHRRLLAKERGWSN
jgi:hypothetical protein